MPDSQGALMVAGYNNWGRMRELRRAWEAQRRRPRGRPPPGARSSRASSRTASSTRTASSCSPTAPTAPCRRPTWAWARRSGGRSRWRIRRDHECAHYFTRRLFGSMRNNLLDELIADYAGISAAAGRFRAAWFLRFLGLEPAGHDRPGGRLDIYRGDPPLSDGAFAVLQRWSGRRPRTWSASTARWPRAARARPGPGPGPRSPSPPCGLEEIASPDGEALLHAKAGELRGRLRWRQAGA